jgi:hypothetical protein
MYTFHYNKKVHVVFILFILFILYHSMVNRSEQKSEQFRNKIEQLLNNLEINRTITEQFRKLILCVINYGVTNKKVIVYPIYLK